MTGHDFSTSSPRFGSLAHPRLGVAVAVETYGFAGLDVVLQHIEDGAYLVIAGSNLGIHTLPETGEGFGHSGVECYHGRGTVDAAARSAELKAVAREGKGRRAVAVGIVDDEVGNLRNVNLHAFLVFYLRLLTSFYLVEQFGQLGVEE